MYINNNPDYLEFLKDKKIYIWGAGEKGKKCSYKLHKLQYNICGFIDNDVTKVNTFLGDMPIVSFNEFINSNDLQTMVIICSSYERKIAEQMLNSGVYNYISESDIDFGGGEDYYDENYFAFQRRLGEFGGKIKYRLFRPYIHENMTVVEFGSGGGYLLKEITAKQKIGIEINDVARQCANDNGIECVKKISDLPDDFADIIISTSVLEHVENPLGCLRELRCKLKQGGKMVFYVPNESCEKEYTRSEINNHLYTWNCLNLGNLFKAAGLFVYKVERIQEVWPRQYEKIRNEVSDELFDEICRIGGRAFEENRCVIVAIK